MNAQMLKTTLRKQVDGPAGSMQAGPKKKR